MTATSPVRSPLGRMLLMFVALVISLSADAHHAARQGTAATPAATPEEVRTYEAFRTWITSQAPDTQRASDDEIFQRYGAELRKQGLGVRITVTAAPIRGRA